MDAVDGGIENDVCVATIVRDVCVATIARDVCVATIARDVCVSVDINDARESNVAYDVCVTVVVIYSDRPRLFWFRETDGTVKLTRFDVRKFVLRL